MLVLLLLADKDIDGEVGGGMALPRDRLGEGYETLSGTEGGSRGEYGKRSWLATADKVSMPCVSASLARDPLPHRWLRDWAKAIALDSAREVSISSAYGSELSTNITSEQYQPSVLPFFFWFRAVLPCLGISNQTLSLSNVFLYE